MVKQRCAAGLRIATVVAIILLTSLNTLLVHASVVAMDASPESVATEFYNWYIKTVARHEDPMTDYPSELSAYVSKPLIAEVRRGMATEGGLEADYFMQAQDYLDDWLTNVVPTKSKIRGNTATLKIVLGASPETRQRLALTFIREQGAWKMRKVHPLQ